MKLKFPLWKELFNLGNPSQNTNSEQTFSSVYSVGILLRRVIFSIVNICNCGNLKACTPWFIFLFQRREKAAVFFFACFIQPTVSGALNRLLSWAVIGLTRG